MSPSPMAPSMASVRACRPASASEWPIRVWSWAISTPHSQTDVAGPEAVGVEALARCARSGAADQRFGHGEILRDRSASSAAGRRATMAHAAAGALDHRGVVGRRLAGGPGGVGGAAAGRARKACGRLGAPEAVARDGRRRPGRRRACRVSATGRAGRAPSAPASAASRRSMTAGVDEGAGGVVDQHRLGRRRRSGRPGRPATESARVVAAGRRRASRSGRPGPRPRASSASAATTTTTSSRAGRQQAPRPTSARRACRPAARHCLAPAGAGAGAGGDDDGGEGHGAGVVIARPSNRRGCA